MLKTFENIRIFYILLIALSFSVGYTLNLSFAQNQTEIEANVESIMTLISAIIGIVTTLAGVVPLFIWFKQKVLKQKHELDDVFLEGSKKIRESDFWNLETQEKFRIGITGLQRVSTDMLNILTQNREKLNVNAAYLDKVRDELSNIIMILPKPEETETIRKELETIRDDPKQMG